MSKLDEKENNHVAKVRSPVSIVRRNFQNFVLQEKLSLKIQNFLDTLRTMTQTNLFLKS